MSSSRGGRLAEHAGLIIVAAFLIGVIWAAFSEGSAAATRRFSPDAPLPVTPDVEVDSLDNGLRFYVGQNDNPKHSLELRLVVNAGSVMEDDDQRGLAHGVEHMAFRGTKRFHHEALVHYMRSIGLRDGDDLNAFTNQDYTYFRLTIPTDQDGAVDRAFDVLEDWASAVTFDSLDATRERDIVIAEARMHRDASDRLDDARDSLMLAGSRYAVRNPIGTTDVLRRFDPAAMRRFYAKWYHPELMAVVAIGDLPTDSLRTLVRAHFAGIPRGAITRPTYATPLTTGLRTAVLRDPEADGVTIGLWHPERRDGARTVADARQQIVSQLFDDMISRRLDALASRPSAPVVSAWTDGDRVSKSVFAWSAQAELPMTQVRPGIDSLLSELARAQRDGFTSAELARAVRVTRSAAERRLDDDPEEAHAATVADDAVDHFALGSPLASERFIDSLTLQVLDSVSLGDVNAVARRRLGASGSFLVLSAPATAHVPDERALALADSLARTRPVVAFVPDTATTLLTGPAPKAGKIVAERTLHAIGVTEWTLSNGMRVLLKPTSFRSDEVRFDAYAPGGASIAEPRDFFDAFMADGVLEATGVGSYSPSALGRALEDEPVSLSPTMSRDYLTLSGSATSRSLETLLQLFHLYMTSPRPDAAGFARWRDRQAEELVADSDDPDSVFEDSVSITLAQHSPVWGRQTPQRMRALDMQKSLAFWSARTANASNFTVVFVGNASEARLRPLVERYLASLPAGHREVPVDRGPHLPMAALTRVIHAGTDDRAATSLTWTGAYPSDETQMYALGVLRELIANALDARLRGKLGATYSVDVSLGSGAFPHRDLALRADFTAAPQRLDELAAAADSVIERFRTLGPTLAELNAVRAARHRDIDEGMERNGWWEDELTGHLENGWSLESITSHGKTLDALTPAQLRDLAAKLLDPARRVRVDRLPD